MFVSAGRRSCGRVFAIDETPPLGRRPVDHPLCITIEPAPAVGGKLSDTQRGPEVRFFEAGNAFALGERDQSVHSNHFFLPSSMERFRRASELWLFTNCCAVLRITSKNSACSLSEIIRKWIERIFLR